MNNENSEIVVSICCITYNHEPYIRDAIEGFLMQKTNFPFEILIHDDASTDGTADIIREYEAKYPDIIKPIYETENQWQKGRRGSVIFNFPRAKGKYIALCEGDDYWIDPYKLQKQVDFLEANPEYGLVHTNYKVLNANSLRKIKYKKDGWYLQDFLLGASSIGTLTIMFRKDLYDKLPKYFQNQKFKIGDLPLRIEFAHASKIKFLSDCTAMYRVLDESASHNKDIEKAINFHKETLRIRLFYIEQYNFKSLKNRSLKTFYSIAVKIAYEKQNVYYSNKYFRKLCKIGFPSLKTVIFFFGTKYKMFNRFIHLMYKI